MVSLEGLPVRLGAKLVWAFGLCVALLAPRLAAAQGVREAVSLYRAGQLDRALDAFARLRVAGGRDTEALATICLHLGILRTGAGDTEGGREAFECLLAIRPDAALPPDLGPAIEGVFGEARRAVGDRPLSMILRVPDSVPANRSLEIRAGATGGAAPLVATTRLTIVSASGRSEIDLRGPGPHQKEVRAPPSIGQLEVREELRDRTGWVLAETSSPVRVTGPLPGSGERRPDDGEEGASTPITGRWWFWTGVGAVVAGGIVLAVAAASSEDGAEVGAPSIVGDL